jgi:hypothetical protein
MIDFFSSPKDLLDKAKHDFSLLKEHKSEILDYYSIFNTLVSLDHLLDWVLNNDELTEEYKLNCFNRFNPYKESSKCPFSEYKKIFPFPNYNHRQEIIRDLCNNLKHYKIFKKENENINYRKEAVKDIAEQKINVAQAGTMCARAFPSPSCAGYYDYHFIIVDLSQEETNIDIITLFEKSISEWDEFLSSMQPHNAGIFVIVHAKTRYKTSWF